MATRSTLKRLLAEQVPRRIGRLDADAILRPARLLYSDADIGVDEIMRPLRVFVESVNAEDNLTAFGHLWSRVYCHDLATHRAEIARTLRKMPEIRDVQIRKPIFVLGLPRTGTTFLHNLLACDTRSRVPLLWEAYAPMRPTPPGSWRAKVSVARDRPRLMINEIINPELQAIHPLASDRPAECFWMLQHSFLELHFWLLFGAWGYRDWLATQDMTGAYGYYRQLLKILMYGRTEERLVLKYPFHSNHLDALLHWFPDARFVQIHRDPAQVVPSMASLTSTLQKPNVRQRDLPRIGTAMLETCLEAAAVGARMRARLPPDRFFDVSYEDFVADSPGTVERMYDHFGLTGASDLPARLREFVVANPQNKHGAHRYSAEEFGLGADRIADAFARLDGSRAARSA